MKEEVTPQEHSTGSWMGNIKKDQSYPTLIPPWRDKHDCCRKQILVNEKMKITVMHVTDFSWVQEEACVHDLNKGPDE